MKQLNFNHKLSIPALLIAGSFILLQPTFANDNIGKEEPIKKEKKKPAKQNNKTGTLNNAAVKIFPDIIKREMHVVAKDGNDVLDFFVFDIQGSLVNNYKMKSKDHIKLTSLNRGIYIYRVFNGDTETATGQFEIR
ncbi:MAG: T9SS type A sorting domain-containing protein [Bacteroidetes bacterium]|nr:T9SS type A sorting domain-containing protein [Bacteroidota bacterium]